MSEYEALLLEYGALLFEHRALLLEYTALLLDCTALLSIPRSAFGYKSVREQNIGLSLCEYRALLLKDWAHLIGI